jgi:hypothetical protein
VYNLLLGLFFVAFMGREWFLFIQITTLLVYSAILLRPASSTIPVTIIAFAALSYVHIYRQLVHSTTSTIPLV